MCDGVFDCPGVDEQQWQCKERNHTIGKFMHTKLCYKNMATKHFLDPSLGLATGLHFLLFYSERPNEEAGIEPVFRSKGN